MASPGANVMAGMALDVATAGPDEMKKKPEDDVARWAKLALELGIVLLDGCGARGRAGGRAGGRAAISSQ